MANLTTNYGWTMPANLGSDNTWGVVLNGDLQAIDSQVWANAHASELGSYGAVGIPATMSFYNGLASVGPPNQQLRWQWQMDNVTESGTLVGSNFNLLAYDNTGVLIGPAFTAQRSGTLSTGGTAPLVTFNSNAQFNQSLTSGSIITSNSVSGLTYVAATFRATPGGTTGLTPQTIGTITVTPNNTSGGQEGAITIGTNTCHVRFGGSIGVPGGGTIVTAGGGMTVNGVNTAGFTIDGNAFKPGGGSWTATSDERIKTVEAEYLHGLEEVCQLRPVVYRYKGNDGGGHDPDKTHIGLVAQEVEAVMPEMVTQGEGLIDGLQVDDLRMLDTTALVFALVNCIRALHRRVEELEAR